MGEGIEKKKIGIPAGTFAAFDNRMRKKTAPTPAEEPETPPVIEEPAAEPEVEPLPDVPTGTNPLTGLPIEPEYEQRRPVAVMLNNLKKAQPQLGNSQADIIYEVPAEGGITRMLAVYQSLEDVGSIGSIRSARPYYIEPRRNRKV